MWHIRKTDPLSLIRGSKYISFAGGGGKTTLIKTAAGSAARAGFSVAVTTTTKIFAEEPHVLIDALDPGRLHESTTAEGFVRVGKLKEGEKLTGLDFAEVEELGRHFDVVLIEADGAKRLPLKCQADHEPVIPPFSDRVLVVAGLDALHKPLRECVFRWELCPSFVDTSPGATVTPEVFVQFFSGSILLKGVEGGRCSVILNKYDALADKGEALGIAKEIVKNTGCLGAFITSPRHGLFYEAGLCREG